MNKSTILLVLLENFPMTFQEITDECESNRNRCRVTLNQLIEKGLIRTSPVNWRRGQKLFFSLTRKGRNEALEEIGNALHTNYAILKNDLEKTLTPTTLDHIRHEAAFHPTENEMKTGCIEAERIKEMIEHKEKVLAPLNNLFFELAKVIVKAEGSSINVREDLENVEFHFKEGKPIWMTHPDKKLQGQGTGLSSRQWNCRRCGKPAFIVLGTNGLCPACRELPKTLGSPNNRF